MKMFVKSSLHWTAGALAVAILAFAVRQQQYHPMRLFLDTMDDIFAFINQHTPPITQQRYTEGNFVPCAGPLSTSNLQVIGGGKLPENLTGTYIRNGANAMMMPPRRTHHMFDGESFPHRIRIDSDSGDVKQIRYDRSWLDSPRYKVLSSHAEKHGKYRDMDASFGDIARGGFFFLFKFLLVQMRIKWGLAPSMPIEYYGTHSTAIIAHHGKLFAAVEVSFPLSFELGTTSGDIKADPEGAKPFRDDKGEEQQTAFSAHPKICPRTGDMFFVSKKNEPALLGLNQVSKEGKLLKSLTGSITSEDRTNPFFVHDFWLTEHFAVFFDASMRFDPSQIPKGGNAISWNDTFKMRFGVLPRDSNSFQDDIIWCETNSPGHIWHIINGWETSTVGGGGDDDDVVRISLFAPKFSTYLNSVPIHTPEEPPSHLTRWDLTLKVASKSCNVLEKQLREEIVERPSTNLRFHGSSQSKWAFLRSEGTKESASMGGTILKVNLETGELVATFDCEDMEPCVTGEALFVPKNLDYTKVYPFVGPEGLAATEQEDDGYLLDLVYYPKRNTSEFVVWDAAASGSAFPIARVALPERVPYGVHAWFVPSDLYSASF